MPASALSTGLSPPSLDSPASGSSLGSSPLLAWLTTTDDAWAGVPVHFQVQIATDSGFSSIVQNVFSSQSVSGFEYESSAGVWTPLPSSGLAEADLGKRVRYAPNLIATQTYFWRVSIQQFF